MEHVSYLNIYIGVAASVVFTMALLSIIITHVRADTFKLPTITKSVSFATLTLDLVGGALVITGAIYDPTHPLSTVFEHFGIAMIMTSTSLLLSLFVWVHNFYIPRKRANGGS
jgi:hypothetical protein